MSKRKILLNLAKQYNVQLKLKANWPDHGSVDLETEIIYIQFKQSYSLHFLLSTFYHELAHLLCKRNGKFKLFHTVHLEKLSKPQQASFLRTLWRAEVYVDKLAKSMMKQDYPNAKFLTGYTQKKKSQFQPLMVYQYKEYFNKVNKRKS